MIRNYLYVSDAKVDAYLPQITAAEKQKVSAKLGFNVGLLSGELRTERMSLDNRIYRLAAVEAEIRRTQTIGSPTSPASWIDGTLSVSPAVFKSEPDLMFFFADNERHFLGLAGSAHHVIGNLRPSTATTSLSYLHSLLGTLSGIEGKFAGVLKKEDPELEHYIHVGKRTESVRQWTRVLESISNQFAETPRLVVSFLARRLISQAFPEGGRRYTLASPLYLAVEDS